MSVYSLHVTYTVNHFHREQYYSITILCKYFEIVSNDLLN